MKKKQKATTKYDEHKLAVGEVKRHMSALGEEYQGRINAFVEQFNGIHKRFDLIDEKFKVVDIRLNGIDKKLDTHTEMIARIMVQLEEIKAESRQKVDLQLFGKLEKRVALLESKSHR